MSTMAHASRRGLDRALQARHRTVRRAFTLIEILIVVVILGVLAAIVTAQFSNASEETNETSTKRQLQIVRVQIELYRAQFRQDPDLIGGQWDDLLQTDLLHSEPRNAFNHNVAIAGAPGAGVGWVWRDSGSGRWGLYATDSTSTAEFVE